MHVILFPGQPKQPRVLLLPDRLPVRAAEPDHVHGDPDHGLLQTPRGHRGPGLQERRDHLRGVRGRIQGDAAEMLEVRPQRVPRVPRLPHGVPQRDRPRVLAVCWGQDQHLGQHILYTGHMFSGI